MDRQLIGIKLFVVNITSGAAANGVSGSGLGAAGSNGNTGGGGNNGSCDGAPGNGGTGGATVGGGARAGGNGGNGGRGGDGDASGCVSGASGTVGSNGGAGAARDPSAGGGGGGGRPGGPGASASGGIGVSEATNGTLGTPNHTAGDRPTNITYSNFFVPAPQSANGGDGTGGGGGAGGGGGGSNAECGCCWCVVDDGGGNGGGAGGSGGQGGQGGAGAWGAGSSFPRWVNGTLGTISSTTLVAGTAGTGGTGQTGGGGGTGGNGGSGAGACTGEVGAGGNGSKGANGAAGGRGRDGATGISAQVLSQSGGTGTTSSPSVTIPTSPTVTINYNNYKPCRNSEIYLSTSQVSPTWSFSGTGFATVNDCRGNLGSTTLNSTSPIVYTNTANQTSSITVGGVTFTDYLVISADARTAPVITPSASTICIGGSVDMSKTSWNTPEDFDWDVFDGNNVTSPACGAALTSNLTTNTSNSATPTFGPFNTAGVYTIKYKEKDGCCGWSIPAYTTVTVVADPTMLTQPTDADICQNYSLTLTTAATGGTGTFSYQWQVSTSNCPMAGQMWHLEAMLLPILYQQLQQGNIFSDALLHKLA
ncbi:MAG: hypothetical protein IPN94_26995 [Sphingobacteriales bacterium]|nr:hypothetical protein [Sphingobacteriales bacterium]